MIMSPKVDDTRAPPPPPAYDSAYEAPQPLASPSTSSPTTASHPETLVGTHLPTIIFAIPFPTPIRSHKQPTSPYLLYTLPRAPYEKPGRDAYGRKGKEGMVKKAERKWQEEIAQGERIRLGQEPDAGRWKRFKGKAVGIADGVIHYLPNSRIEALGRVPPKKKLGHVWSPVV
ncbi:hypothetical protein BDZ89DRAFT_380851 [Hymenopellis radicata]|nr:hypothetical protein BDZ89DRAFT_380851 [Hymenopellis radicata]